MARFRGGVQGQRGPAFRLGGVRSGIQTNTNGWRSGIRVQGIAHGSRDIFKISATHGSGGSGGQHIATVMRGRGGNLIVHGASGNCQVRPHSRSGKPVRGFNRVCPRRGTVHGSY